MMLSPRYSFAGIFVVAKLLSMSDPVLSLLTFVLFGISVVELLASKNFANGALCTASSIAMIANLWNMWRAREREHWQMEKKALLERIETKERQRIAAQNDARAESERSREVQERNADQIEHLKAALAEADTLHKKQELQLAQVSAEVLLDRGVVAHSGSRRTLRAAASPSNHSVLVVEDDPPLRQAMMRVLILYGLRVEVAESVAESTHMIGLRQRVGPPFDFAILDVHLPDGSGIEVLETIHRARIETDVIVCSGQLDEALVARTREFGAAAVLVKPFDLDELLALLGIDTTRKAPGSDSGPMPAQSPQELD